MKHLFNNISEEERKNILEMHESATKKQYLKEQADESHMKIWQGIKSQLSKYKPKSTISKRTGMIMYGTNPFQTYSQETLTFTIPSIAEFKLHYPYSETEAPDYEQDFVGLTKITKNGYEPQEKIPLNLQSIMSNLK